MLQRGSQDNAIIAVDDSVDGPPSQPFVLAQCFWEWQQAWGRHRRKIRRPADSRGPSDH
jgi:hypothetical protein